MIAVFLRGAKWIEKRHVTLHVFMWGSELGHRCSSPPESFFTDLPSLLLRNIEMMETLLQNTKTSTLLLRSNLHLCSGISTTVDYNPEIVRLTNKRSFVGPSEDANFAKTSVETSQYLSNTTASLLQRYFTQSPSASVQQ